MPTKFNDAATRQAAKKRAKFQLVNDYVQLAAQLHNLREALANRFYEVGNYSDCRKCVAVPLVAAERDAVWKFARDFVSNVLLEGELRNEVRQTLEGDADSSIVACDCKQVCEWGFEVILPRFAGLLVDYHYDHRDGISINEIHGLLVIEG